ncbi:MAG: NAD(P)-dependent oxidoreductase [Gammaproteobacteria bacterium]|nr:NAD(P)-dependent oxidoreductase [Gammaproteobacteria bacterium]
MSRPKLLITGAAGRVGKAFIESAGRHFTLRLADSRPIQHAPEGAELVHLDIRDADSCRAACHGVDLVLHLAADPSPAADFLSSLLPTNIVGTYNLFSAAVEAGCKRLVFASSAQAIEGYPVDLQVPETAPPRPGNMYGVTKAFGEALAAYYAHAHSISCIAVRIANVAIFSPDERHSPRDVAAFISERDLAHLLQRALLADEKGFCVVNGVSNNRYKRLAIEETKQVLGYSPTDDAFELLKFPGGYPQRTD